MQSALQIEVWCRSWCCTDNDVKDLKSLGPLRLYWSVVYFRLRAG